MSSGSENLAAGASIACSTRGGEAFSRLAAVTEYSPLATMLLALSLGGVVLTDRLVRRVLALAILPDARLGVGAGIVLLDLRASARSRSTLTVLGEGTIARLSSVLGLMDDCTLTGLLTVLAVQRASGPGGPGRVDAILRSSDTDLAAGIPSALGVESAGGLRGGVAGLGLANTSVQSTSSSGVTLGRGHTGRARRRFTLSAVNSEGPTATSSNTSGLVGVVTGTLLALGTSPGTLVVVGTGSGGSVRALLLDAGIVLPGTRVISIAVRLGTSGGSGVLELALELTLGSARVPEAASGTLARALSNVQIAGHGARAGPVTGLGGGTVSLGSEEIALLVARSNLVVVETQWVGIAGTLSRSEVARTTAFTIGPSAAILRGSSFASLLGSVLARARFALTLGVVPLAVSISIASRLISSIRVSVLTVVNTLVGVPAASGCRTIVGVGEEGASIHTSGRAVIAGGISLASRLSRSARSVLDVTSGVASVVVPDAHLGLIGKLSIAGALVGVVVTVHRASSHTLAANLTPHTLGIGAALISSTVLAIARGHTLLVLGVPLALLVVTLSG